MKDKILIIGAQGAGKTEVANNLAKRLGYKVVDEVGSIEEVKKKATPKTIYVSNAIDEKTTLWHLEDFIIIKLILA